jgi:hypothetical protein
MKSRRLGMMIVFLCVALLSSHPALAEFAQQGPKLVGSAGSFPSQGWSTALSADGNTAIVGGYNDDSARGAVWVFTRNAGVWTQQGPKLVAPDEQDGDQGWSVALSADGNTAIVGGTTDFFSSAVAYVWTRNAGHWARGARLVGTGATQPAPGVGYSVAISADGNTAILGEYYDNGNVGAAWIFKRTSGGWSQQGSKLVGTGAVGKAKQGASVALSADGNTAAVGGYTDNTARGAVWIWTRSGSVWTQQSAKLVGTGGAGAASYQGSSVSLSADGNTAFIGGYSDDSGFGAAWVWKRTSGVWGQQGNKLVGSREVSGQGDAQQGWSVSLSADGNTAIVGGPGDYPAGASWIWKRSGSTWTQQGNKIVGTGAVGDGLQGFSVSLSGDGKTALVGGPNDDPSNDTGAVWVFFAARSERLPGRSSVVPVAAPAPAIVDGRGP